MPTWRVITALARAKARETAVMTAAVIKPRTTFLAPRDVAGYDRICGIWWDTGGYRLDTHGFHEDVVQLRSPVAARSRPPVASVPHPPSAPPAHTPPASRAQHPLVRPALRAHASACAHTCYACEASHPSSCIRCLGTDAEPSRLDIVAKLHRVAG